VKILFVASECVPFIKSGGLADVAGALPKELINLGSDVRVMLPKYSLIPDKYREKMEKIAEFTVNIGWRRQYCGVEKLVLNDVIYYFIDNEYYFYRDSLYGHYDDGERFSYFCRAILESIRYIDFIPDVLHCHDWHTGMVNFLLSSDYSQRAEYAEIQSVFTIHNLQFQGIFPRTILHDLLNLGDDYFTPELLEFHGNINFMKAALVSSDIITTVSPTYKQEIQTEYYGEKLDGILRNRADSLVGIINGIDDTDYNPKLDKNIAKSFGPDSIQAKQLNKTALQTFFELPKKDVPVLSIVSRLTEQKGLDLVTCVLEELLQTEDIQVIVLGTGASKYEHFFGSLAYHYPEKFKVFIGFNEQLARRIYAGSDLFLMPSKFEPCGLGQLIAMSYGAIPIVRETGGLNDTVQSFDEETLQGNGFSFTNFNAHDMLYTIRRAISIYHQEKTWESLVKEAMSQDNSWAQSAFKYNQLYAELLAGRGSHVFK